MEVLARESGVNFQTISKHEAGQVKSYHPDTALLIANALEVELEDVFKIVKGRWADRVLGVWA